MSQPHRILTARAALGVIAFVCAWGVAAAEVDVRILIDVSGSMKENDPQNLRIPAVRLVAELMPQGATAGIWAFGEAVEVMLPPSQVDAKWKSNAIKVTQKIHSRGLFTNIEAALDAAMQDWESTEAGDTARHVILLTDGVVDVSKHPAESAASRQRLLTSGLAKMQTLGAEIHTIALSANSDRELMSKLAETTEGWAEEVEEAAQLQRVFLHMFEQAASPDSVPLLENRFEVDESISEMTLLVFHDENAKPLRLTTPDGAALDAKSVPDNVNWRADGAYDLVTVAEPATGTWQINSEPDPDNRVLIVTDLKLALADLPTNYLGDEAMLVRAHITEHGHILKRADFLDLLEARLMATPSSGGDAQEFPLPLDKDAAAFTDELTVDWSSGEYEVVVRVDGGTFKRQQRTKIRVHGAPITFTSATVGDGAAIEFTAAAEQGLVDLQTLSGLLVVSKPDGASEVFDLPSFTESKVSLTIPASHNGTYELTPRILGRSTSGRPISMKATPLKAEITANAESSEPVVDALPSVPVAPSINWLHAGGMTLIGNTVLAALLAAMWFVLGRRTGTPTEEMVVK